MGQEYDTSDAVGFRLQLVRGAGLGFVPLNVPFAHLSKWYLVIFSTLIFSPLVILSFETV